MSVQQWPLVYRSNWGTTTVPRPTFIQHDSTYYQVSITDERQLECKRWHFGAERVEETPSDEATVVETPVDTSSQDKRVIEAAMSAVYAGSDDFLGEPEFEELPTVEYHQGLDAEASELIPSPPFDYVKHQHNGEYYRPVTEQRIVSVPEWIYTITELGSTPAELTDHAKSEIVTHDLSNGLTGAAQDVVDDAISEEVPFRYDENEPPSDPLEDVLSRLDIAGDLQPAEVYLERVAFAGVVAMYNGSTYSFGLIVSVSR